MINPFFDATNFDNYKFNPYFDWTSMYLWPDPIPTRQVKFENKNKLFNKHISTLLSNSKASNPEWPFRNPLLVQLVITGGRTFMKSKDIDNLSKSVIDAHKGFVFEDDGQIEVLQVIKRQLVKSSDSPAIYIGIKRIDTGHIPENSPTMFVPKTESEKQQSYIDDPNDTSLITLQFGDEKMTYVIKGKGTKEKYDEAYELMTAQIELYKKRKGI